MASLAIAVSLALLASPVALPAPRTDGQASIEAALRQRRSVRKFAAAPLTLQEAGQLCWAAQGVTDEKGHRTAPSARATYPLSLYVVAGNVAGLAAGLYRYLPAEHALEPLGPGDQRADFAAKGVGQAWIAEAAAVFVLSGDASKTGGGERGRQFMWVEAGLAAQGFFLQATAMGLGGTYVGGFRPAEAREALGLPAREEVLAVLPVGRKP